MLQQQHQDQPPTGRMPRGRRPNDFPHTDTCRLLGYTISRDSERIANAIVVVLPLIHSIPLLSFFASMMPTKEDYNNNSCNHSAFLSTALESVAHHLINIFLFGKNDDDFQN
mmetsp:Transcript_18956/g.44317  ORF Transcript_18956/g.44317 Transcript_18956/m.44317 type:complete len:112 (-) Transcript_18956:109-444(-)